MALEQLDISSTGVTDEGLKSLAGLMKLSELDVGSTKVAAPGATELLKALPKLKISGVKKEKEKEKEKDKEKDKDK